MSAPGLHLRKYEGAGNDFLVCFDLADERPLTPGEVRAVCDRHHGVGADGLVRALAGPAGTDVRMELHNADGSRAEMSGNGARCLAHAVVDAGMVAGDEVVLATDAGVRRVTLSVTGDGAVAEGALTMGVAGLGAEVALADLVPGVVAPEGRARRVDMGNPHLVVVVAGAEPGLLGWARAVDAATPGGTNVELVHRRPDGHLGLVVWERGAGETLACGTGSCAAAAVCADWGLVDMPVVVHNPGGPLRVDRRHGELVLAGPSRRVAEVQVDGAVLAGARTADAGTAGARTSGAQGSGVVLR